MEFSILLDAPLTPVGEVQIAKLGDAFNHPKHGDLAITRADVEAWQRNLALLPGGRAPIDEDHMADRTPRRTEASGWITDVRLDGDTPRATVEWTDKGRDAITNKRYLFISPTYGPFRDEHGEVHDNTLIGAALTNRPFLNMPAITLASPERVSEAAGAELVRLLENVNDDLLDSLELGAEQLVTLEALTGKAMNDLPDSAFAYIEPGGTKDADGKTVPRSKRHFAIHDEPHVRNALARMSQSPFGSKAASKINAAAKKMGIGKPAKSLDSRAPMDTEVLIRTLDLATDTDDDGVVARVTALHSQRAELLKTLDLPADAGDDDVNKALAKLAKKAAKRDLAPGETKTLEQAAASEGKVLLDVDQWKAVKKRAQDGTTALERIKTLESERAEERFETQFTALEQSGHFAESDRDDEHHFYTLDADRWLERTARLAQEEPKINRTPSGLPAIDFTLDGGGIDPRQLAAAGVHPESHVLDQKIRKHMLDNKIPPTDYVKVFEQVQSGAVVL